MATKVCAKCKLPKPEEEFYWANPAKTARRSKCKKCVREDNTQYEATSGRDWQAYKREQAKKELQESPDETRKKRAAYARKYLRKLRQQVIAHLGGKCCRCGFGDWRALQVDHVNGGGVVERQLINGTGALMRKVLADTTGKYQLLCANCNWIKRYENGEGWEGGT